MKRVAKLILLLVACVAGGVLWKQAELAVLALGRIDPVPQVQDWVAQGRYAEAAEYLDFFMEYPYVHDDPVAQALAREIARIRESFPYQISKFREGLVEGTSDETLGQVVGVATDFLVVGDVRDLTHQALNWSQGAELDEVVVALSAIGLAATGAQVVSGGGATPVKGGLVFLKRARKLGQLPPWLGRALVDGVQGARRTGTLEGIGDLFADLYRLSAHAGTAHGLRLLRHTQDAASLKRMARFAETFGPQSAILFHMGGEAALRVGARAARLGRDTIKLAATYGLGGLRILDQVGAIRFIKYTSRAGKVAYKGDFTQLLARLASLLPHGLLYLLMGLGAWVWVPWAWFRRGFRRAPIPCPSPSP